MLPTKEIKLPFRKLPTCWHVEAFLKYVNEESEKSNPRREFSYTIDHTDFITIRSDVWTIDRIKTEFERINQLKVVKYEVST